MSSHPQIDPTLNSLPSVSSFLANPNPNPNNVSAEDTPTKAAKTRTAISELERKSLRDYAHQYPKTPHKELATWFQSNFNHRIAQSSISDSLGVRFVYLDTLSADSLTADGESKRRRDPSFPELEKRLVEWYQSSIARGEQVTGELVKKVAASLWSGMSEYSGKEMPKWSNGWLEGWKQRNSITFRTHAVEGEKSAGKRVRSEVDDRIERELEGAKRRETARLQTTSAPRSLPSATPWDMLRPENPMSQNGDVESWDMLRPIADSLHEPAESDLEREAPADSPLQHEANPSRPGYDPAMPAWLRDRTWDELPWVKDGSMGLSRAKARQKRMEWSTW